MPLRLRVLSAVMDPILLGIEPDKELRAKLKCRSDVNSTVESGMLPRSKLSSNWRSVRDLIEPVIEGIVPDNLFEDSFMLLILFDQLTTLFGMLPFKALSAMSNLTKLWK